MQQLLKKSIKDIPTGQSSAEGYDYSHLLKPKQLTDGYKLRVSFDSEHNNLKASIHKDGSNSLGEVTGFLDDEEMHPHVLLGLYPKLKGQGFGRAMYEALYSHAYNNHGITTISGGYHTAAAKRIHERLAQKHSLDYKPKPGFPVPNGEPEQGGHYKYVLKDESDIAKAEFQQAGFRHIGTGKIFPVGSFHDIGKLPGGDYENPNDPEDMGGFNVNDYEAGFLDHQGKFYTRHQAAERLGIHRSGPAGEVESSQYFSGAADPTVEAFHVKWPKAPPVAKSELKKYDELDLPFHIQHFVDAVKSGPNSKSGRIEIEALWHLLDGVNTGWDRMIINTSIGPHWFLKHKKTKIILDPIKGTSQNYKLGRPAVNLPVVPSKLAQNLVDKIQGDLAFEEHTKAPELVKSIKNIQPGKILSYNPKTSESLHDYNHILPKQLQTDGYKLQVHHIPRINGVTSRVYSPNGEVAGSVTAFHDIEGGDPVLGIDNSLVKPQFRGQGLGTSLYEAVYAFGSHNLKSKKIVGNEHTSAASAVHKKLAAKHGLNYQPEWKQKQASGPYEYLIKDEIRQPEIGYPDRTPYAPKPDPNNYQLYRSPMGYHLLTPRNIEQWFDSHEDREKYLKWHSRNSKAGIISHEVGIQKTEDSNPPIATSVLVYNEFGQVLIGVRENGKFVFPGGSLEPNEDPKTGAIRELYEESGLIPDSIQHIKTSNNDSGIPIFLFVARVHDQVPHNKNDPDFEVKEWKWINALMGLPPEISQNMAHGRDVLVEHMGWGEI